MKRFLIILCSFLIFMEIMLFAELSVFIKKHREETVESNFNAIMRRIVCIFCVPIIIILLVIIF